MSGFNEIEYSSVIQKMDIAAHEFRPFIFMLDFEKKHGFFSLIDELDNDTIKSNLLQEIFPEPSFTFLKELELEIQHIPFKCYLELFSKIQSEIQKGNTYLINLTFKTPVYSNYTLLDIYRISKAKYKLYIKDKFVLFSPERFVRIHGNQISTNPMKGTLDANEPGNDVLLLNDLKENAEHNTIVDLLRNDLSMVATNVYVKRFKYLDRIETMNGALWQMSSEICGEIRTGYENKLGTLIDQLLPAGSISGAPKQKTIEIITDTENYDRGYYTGIFGIYDGQQLDSAVMIRFIEKEGENLYYKSGGGITFMAEAEKEYSELIKKIYVPVF